MANQALKYGVLGLVGLLSGGLILLGIGRYQADQRAREAARLVPELSQTTAATGFGQAPLPAPSAGAVPDPAPEETLLVIHVVGAVSDPGVYRLATGTRVADAITAAGGALPDGLPDALNLASILSDGDKIYVPMRTAAPATAVAHSATKVPVQAETASQSQSKGCATVNVNQASADQLVRVPGIGPVTARAIVEYRSTAGRFGNLSELDRVKGIGPATLARIRDCLRI